MSEASVGRGKPLDAGVSPSEFLFLFFGEARLEALHAACGIYDFGCTRIERVAVGADFHVQFLFGRAYGKRIAARAPHSCLKVWGVSIGFHRRQHTMVWPEMQYFYLAATLSAHALRAGQIALLAAGFLRVPRADARGLGFPCRCASAIYYPALHSSRASGSARSMTTRGARLNRTLILFILIVTSTI